MKALLLAKEEGTLWLTHGTRAFDRRTAVSASQCGIQWSSCYGQQFTGHCLYGPAAAKQVRKLETGSVTGGATLQELPSSSSVGWEGSFRKGGH